MSMSINPAGTNAPAAPELPALRPIKPLTRDEAAAPASTEKAAQDTKKSEASRQELQQAIERLNEQVKKNNYSLNFSVDEAADYVVVKIRDANNGEVVRQIPNETVLRLSANLKGLLQDAKI